MLTKTRSLKLYLLVQQYFCVRYVMESHQNGQKPAECGNAAQRR